MVSPVPISPFRLYRWVKLLMFAAAWATPMVIQWYRKRQENRREGRRHLQAGNFRPAVEYLSRAVAESERRWLPDKERFELILQLALAHRKLGQFEEATLNVGRAECLVKLDTPAYRRCLDARSDICADSGEMREAQRFAREAARSEPCAARYQRLARLARRTGDVEESRRLFHLAVEHSERIAGPENIETAHLLAELGELCLQEGKHPEAQRTLERAAPIHERVLGPGSDQLIHDLVQMGTSYQQSGDSETALARFERALRLKERQVGGKPEELVALLRNLSEVYIAASRLAPAHELLQRAVVLLDGAKDERLPRVLEKLAFLHERAGRAQDAAHCYEEAALAWHQAGAEYRPQMQEALERSGAVR